jgi:hypothetical protein
MGLRPGTAGGANVDCGVDLADVFLDKGFQVFDGVVLGEVRSWF